MNIKLSKIGFLSISVFIFMIVPFGCIKEKTERADMPKWFLNIPEYPNAYVAVGSGDGRAESLCNALSELSSNIETVVSSMMGKSGTPKVYKNDTGIHFGKVSVQSVSKIFLLENGSEEHFSLVSTANFVDEIKTYKISAFYEETKNNGVTTSRTHFTVTCENSDLGDVIGELKRSGIEIETYAGKKSYYMKLVIDKDKLKSNIP